MRPKNWDKKISALLEKMPLANSTEAKVFGMNCMEFGADAMLEGLFEMAKESPTGTFVIDSRVVNIFNE